jgi:hypothetical protein
MYEREYRKLVLDDFYRKRAVGLLPPELLAPTRKGLRDHCVKVCTERYKKKDEPLLKSFYGERENPAAYLIAVQNAEAEDFRTLNNFLKDQSKGTSFLNISMLAWMIDFELRPFRDDLEIPIVLTPEPEPIAIPTQPAQPSTPEPHPETIDKNPVDEKPENPLPPDNPGIKRPWVYAAVLLLLISLAACYFFTHQGPSANEKGACMIWTGEQYQRVVCSYKPEAGGIAAIPLDADVLKHFKKITKEDTLTANSIGKVYCVKIDGKYEYYTDSAANPVHPERPLRRLTQFIMNNNP